MRIDELMLPHSILIVTQQMNLASENNDVSTTAGLHDPLTGIAISGGHPVLLARRRHVLSSIKLIK